MNDTDLTKPIEHLFDRPWDEDLSEEEEDALDQAADALVSEYGWENVFPAAVAFLHTRCQTPEQAVNFACNYWNYGWYELPVPDPHRFLGYLYYLIGFDAVRNDPIDILDSLATAILPKAGFREADLFLNPRYMPETDPKIIRAVEEFRKEDSSKKA